MIFRVISVVVVRLFFFVVFSLLCNGFGANSSSLMHFYLFAGDEFVCSPAGPVNGATRQSKLCDSSTVEIRCACMPSSTCDEALLLVAKTCMCSEDK